jgi:hypothetical protein
MSITQLFNNLRNHTILRGSTSFSEEDCIESLSSLDFALKTPKIGTKVQQKGRTITCDPSRTYPCGGVCRSQDKPCKNPIQGQAKTYAGFLELQNVKPKEDIKEQAIVEVEPTPKTQTNLANFEEIKKLGESIAAKYLEKANTSYFAEIKKINEELRQLEPELEKAQKAVFSKNTDGIYDGEDYQQLVDNLNNLEDQHGNLVVRLQAANNNTPLEDYKALLDAQYIYNGAKSSLDRFNQGKSIGQSKLNEQELTDKKTELILDFIDKEVKFYEIKDKIEALSYSEFSDLKESLIKSGGKSEADATAWLNSLGKRTPKVKKSDNALKEAYQLTGGNIPTLKSVGYTEPRAYANQQEGFINVGKSERSSVILHEVGHHLEYSNPELLISANNFLQNRSTGKTQTLRKITGSKSFKPDEVALIGSFIDPYVGKLYKSGATEVISMGLERFSTPREMKKFKDKDPEHFHYILGVLAHVNNFKP